MSQSPPRVFAYLDMEALIDRINRIWCETMHDAPMWPMHGRYECRTCGREYRVDWDGEPAKPSAPAVVTWKLAGASK